MVINRKLTYANSNIMHVINFDLPSAEHDGRSEYVHRIGTFPMLWDLLRPLTDVGRTARIGNEGLATSFYNEKDEAMGPFLTKILMECGQEVPEFLQHFRPEDGVLNFDEEDELEDDTVENTDDGQDGGDGWGGADNKTPDNAGGEAWGAADSSASGPADTWGTTNEDSSTSGNW